MGVVNIVCANLIEKDGAFLFVQEAKEIAKGSYNFPAGRMEFGESLLECAVREAKEETGLDVRVEKLVGVYQRPVSAEDSNTTVFCFHSVVQAGSLTPTEKHPVIQYFTYEEVLALHRDHHIRMRFIPLALRDFLDGKGVDPSWVQVLR